MDPTVGFVLQNLVNQQNFVEFLDGRNFTYFEVKQTNDMVTRGMPHGIMKNQVWHVPLGLSAWVTLHLDVMHE